MKLRDLRQLPFAFLRRDAAAGLDESPATACAPDLSAWQPQPLAPDASFVGPARVLRVGQDGRPWVLLPGAGCRALEAEWALPYRYLPAVGDELNVVALGSRAYVIGVAHGRGQSLLYFARGAALRAAGLLRLRGDRGVRVVGERVTVRAQALEVLVGRLEEKVDRALRHTQRRLLERAGSSRRVTEGRDQTIAGRLTLLGAKRVKIDAEQMILG